jgi:hypothetical protein
LSNESPSDGNADFLGKMAAGLVAEYVGRYGEGPAWSQLAGMIGLGPPREHAPIIHHLAELGWLSFTEEPYSLRPGPRYFKHLKEARNGC